MSREENKQNEVSRQGDESDDQPQRGSEHGGTVYLVDETYIPCLSSLRGRGAEA